MSIRQQYKEAYRQARYLIRFSDQYSPAVASQMYANALRVYVIPQHIARAARNSLMQRLDFERQRLHKRYLGKYPFVVAFANPQRIAKWTGSAWVDLHRDLYDDDTWRDRNSRFEL